jgi:predicted nucleotidyltransferase component of viral defense system
MIKAREIQQKAQQDGVRDAQIEKDYILSWILYGVARHQDLSRCLVFKGGTALKKIYFDDYRFSEDLDFTLIDQGLANDQLLTWFTESFVYVREVANIPLSIQPHQEHQDGGLNFYIQYVGPLGGLGANKTVKVDISRNEQLVFPPILKPVIINYTDIEPHELLSYPLEEALAEKLRSVMQRMQARDFYEIWYLLEEYGLQPEFYCDEFCRKCSGKGLKPADFPQKLADRLPQYKARWKSSMNDQIRDLPDFDKVAREVQEHLRKMPFDK